MATPNLDFVMQAGRDPELSRILAQASLVIPDGMPIVWLSGKLGPRLPERVAGSDLILSLSGAAAREGFNVFHLGGAPGVPEKAGEVLKEKFPDYWLAGAYSPPKADLLNMDHAEILRRLEDSQPDILYVAFGAPKQEKWINLHFRDWNAPLALGLGGSLDFLAGAQKRAPKWMQKSGTEWVWRLGTNPKRLWKRYAANFIFLFQALRKIRNIRKLENSPAPVGYPLDANKQPDSAFVPIKWTPLPTPEAAGEFLKAVQEKIGERHAVIDFSNCEWLTSLELGTLVVLGRDAKNQGKYILRTGTGPRLDEWLSFNLLDPLIEPFDPAINWNRRLNPAEVSAISSGEEENPDSRIATFGYLQAGLRKMKDQDKKTCTLVPPEELTAGSLGEWREEVLKVMKELPPDIQCVQIEANGLRFLDSAGLGFFMHLRKLTDDSGCEFQLVNLKGAPLTTLKLARVDKLLLGPHPDDMSSGSSEQDK